MSDTTVQGEARGRRRGRPDRGSGPAEPIVRPQPRLPFAPVDIVSADQLEAVHQAALKILSEVGMDVLNDDARRILKACFEKMILDADLLDMVAEFLKPIRLDEDEFALDTIREVGPGGHFFGCAHTQARYRTAFFSPMISDWHNYENWQEAGMKIGRRPARRPPTTKRTASTRRSWPPTSRRRSSQSGWRRCRSSSKGGKPKAE